MEDGRRDVIEQESFPFYGLTPVRKRKIEPVVMIAEGTGTGLGFAENIPIYAEGQKVRVTFEVVE